MQPRKQTNGPLSIDQAQFFLQQTNDKKTQVSGEDCNAGKCGRKEKRTTSNKVNRLSYCDDEGIIGRSERLQTDYYTKDVSIVAVLKTT